MSVSHRAVCIGILPIETARVEKVQQPLAAYDGEVRIGGGQLAGAGAGAAGVNEDPTASAGFQQLGELEDMSAVDVLAVSLGLQEIPRAVEVHRTVDATVPGVMRISLDAVAAPLEGLQQQFLECEGINLSQVGQTLRHQRDRVDLGQDPPRR